MRKRREKIKGNRNGAVLKLPKAENLKFRQFLAYEYPICQICGKAPSDDAHHVVFGCYGADKDDRKQIAVCRACHDWCHEHKHESIEKYEELADENWAEYEASL